MYDRFYMERAIDKLERVDTEKLSTEGLRNLSNALRNIHNTEEAETYYAELVKRSDAKAKDFLNYANVLLINEKVTESEKWMVKYYSMSKNDERAKDYVSSKGYYEDLKKDIGRFNVTTLSFNSKEQDFGPAYYEDKVVFASSRSWGLFNRVWNWNNLNFLNLYEATPKNDKSELRKVNKFSSKLNKKFHEGPASFTKDGNYVMYTRNNYEEKSSNEEVKLKLFYAEKNGKKWAAPVGVPFNNKEYSVGQASLTADGNLMYFVSDMPGGKGGTDLYISEKKGDSWGTPVNLAALNTEGDEMFPFIHESGMLFFASNGHVSLGGLDVFVTKTSDNKNFSSVQNVGVPVNTSFDDFAMILDSSEKKGYFSSNREEGKGNDDIYAYDLLKPFEFCKEVKGIVYNKEDNSILTGALVSLINNNNEAIETVTVGENGEYVFCTEETGTFKVRATKDGFVDDAKTVTINENSPSQELDLYLSQVKPLVLEASVTDAITGKLLPGATITFKNEGSGNTEKVWTLADGNYSEELTNNKVGDNLNNILVIEKEGYITKVLNYKQALEKPGTYKINTVLDLSLKPGDVIVINEIYFDLDKSNIRPDAALQLDKIVKLMNDYPSLELELGSHTDCRASVAYNRALSQRRATSSARYIKSKITNPKRIKGRGYGESKLINGCACEGAKVSTCSEAEHQKNRRTEFKVIKFDEKDIEIKNNSPISF